MAILVPKYKKLTEGVIAVCEYECEHECVCVCVRANEKTGRGKVGHLNEFQGHRLGLSLSEMVMIMSL